MSADIEPTTVAELADAVRSAPRVIACGAGTKPRLSAVGDDVVRISTARLRGIIEYEPTEFTFTALAGTPVCEIVAAVAQRGQYLPFDPVLSERGATLGGTVAAGLNGPGRLRFGGLRDFILGVRFVDGGGRLLRLGGKVVKNAAGFDVPKFMVGSLGRFGVLAELSFKVFPRPPASLTLRLSVADADAAARILTAAVSARWELDALEYLPASRVVVVRLAGPEAAIAVLAREILQHWPGEEVPLSAAATWWSDLANFGWTHADGVWMKIACTPSQVPVLVPRLSGIPEIRLHAGVAGNVLWLSLPDAVHAAPVGDILRAHSLPAVTLRGAVPLWPGATQKTEIERAVKSALDPAGRFPQLED